jgi:hypothetical protein
MLSQKEFDVIARMTPDTIQQLAAEIEASQ